LRVVISRPAVGAVNTQTVPFHCAICPPLVAHKPVGAGVIGTIYLSFKVGVTGGVPIRWSITGLRLMLPVSNAVTLLETVEKLPGETTDESLIIVSGICLFLICD
jgi:hypothetical protein